MTLTASNSAEAELPLKRTQITTTRAGGPEVLHVETAPMPRPGPGELLVQLQAAGVAFGDITQRQGRNPGPVPPVLGYDVVGLVVAIGPDAKGFHVGQRVAALTVVGGYASHVIAPARWAVPVDPALDAAAVSALTLNYLTARQMLRASRVGPGQSILVLGAAGGVGSALCELAQLDGITVYGTASGPRLATLAARGVLTVADAASLPRPVDAVFDAVGGPSLAASRKATKRSGTVVAYGFSFAVDAGHSRTAGLLRAVMALARAKSTPGARVISFVLPASANKDPAAIRADLGVLLSLLADASLNPAVETMPLSAAAEAHRKLENRQVSGKVVLIADATGA